MLGLWIEKSEGAEGQQIDLSQGWGEAQACFVDQAVGDVECFRDRADLYTRESQLETSVSPSVTCSTPLRLFADASYGGRQAHTRRVLRSASSSTPCAARSASNRPALDPRHRPGGHSLRSQAIDLRELRRYFRNRAWSLSSTNCTTSDQSVRFTRFLFSVSGSGGSRKISNNSCFVSKVSKWNRL